MNYVNYENMQELFDGIARKIGQGGGSGAGLEDWQAEHEYKENDICVYEGQIYRAKVGFISDTTFNTTQILEEYTPIGGETIIPYEQDTEISIDDIVSYDNNTYKALYDFVCGEEFSLYALEEYVPIELTDDDIKEIVGAYNPVFEEAKGIEYSTEERRIGTWIDGKPLYQKTYSFTTPSTNNIETSVCTITDASLIVDCKVFFAGSTGGRYFGNYYDTSNDYIWFYVNSLNEVRMKIYNSYLLNQSGYITVQYTKTTD